MSEITLEDACKFECLDKLEPETQEVMVNAPQELHLYLNKALMESFNTNLMRISHRLRGVGFSAEQAIEVIYNMPAHRPSDGVEIERAVGNAYDTEQGCEIKRSDWPAIEVPLEQVRANIEKAGITPMSENELLEQLGDTPEEIDNVGDFVSHYFKGVERPVYIGGLYHGAIEHVSTWLADPEEIDALGYDQVLANPMKRRLTVEERKETITTPDGKRKLKYASGGRGVEFANETMEVITFESDKLSAEEQFAVIAYLAGLLPLVSIVYSGGKSFHATFSLKGLSREQVMDIRQALANLGGDGGVMSPYQLVRLGAVTSSKKGNKFQRVLWMNGDARNTPPSMDDIAKLLIPHPPEYYHHNGKYYALDGRGQRYIAINDGDLTRQLRLHGYSVKGDNGEMSAVDRLKAHIVMNNSVDHVGAVAGRSIGLHEDKVTGARHLITHKNRRVIAKDGDWSVIRSILEAQYGDQVKYIYSWLRRARYQLEREQFMQGHALAIAGEVGGGKSLVATEVIQPLLGVVGDAHLFLVKDNDFNSDLVGSELLLIDDKALSLKLADRQRFGTRLKEVVGGSKNVKCHGKGTNPFGVNPLWRIVILVNDDERGLGGLPPIGEGDSSSVGDKVLLLKCHKHPLPFVGDPDQFAKLGRLIADQLPPFAHFVDNYKIPAEIKKGDCRFGFDEFQHPTLVEAVNINSNERTLLSATDEIFFQRDWTVGVDLKTDISTSKQFWQGTAENWAKILRSNEHDAKGLIVSTLAYGDTATKAGIQLKKVAKVANGRVIKTRTKTCTMWKIWEPAATVTPDDNEPF